MNTLKLQIWLLVVVAMRPAATSRRWPSMTKAAFLWVALSLSALARCASSPDSLSEVSYQYFFLGRKGLDVFPQN